MKNELGTPWTTLHRSRSIVSSALRASNLVARQSCDPVTKVPTTATTAPKLWKSGRAKNVTSPSPISFQAANLLMRFSSAKCCCSTPLGEPVVPDV